jgi:alpha-1,3-fucosyltransferase
MTYRQDSDFQFLYGHISKVKEHPTDKTELSQLVKTFGKENSKLYSGKSKPIAWFVSNCFSESNRELYVKELQKHMQVSYFYEKKI